MRRDVLDIFGDPVPQGLLLLANSVDDAINKAVMSEEPVKELNVKIEELRKQLNVQVEKRLDAEYLHSRNVGGHYYPGCADTGDVFTSDCKYCECWMGPSRSGAPEGVDQFGDCPGNPKLREAYELLRSKSNECHGSNSTK